MNENRIYYFDLLKSIAIFFVCVYHYADINIDVSKSSDYSVYFNYFIHGILSICVPIFFMVNGALLLNKDFDIKKHVYKIGFLYLLTWLWGAITLLLVAPVKEINYSFDEIYNNLINLKEGVLNHLWFLFAIIYIYLLFPLIKSLYDRNDKNLIIYLLSIIFIFTFGSQLLDTIRSVYGYIFNIDSIVNNETHLFRRINPFNLHSSFSLLYFILGGLIAKNINRDYFRQSSCWVLLLIFSLLLFLFGLMKTNFNNKIYDTVWLGYTSIMTLGMSISVFILSSKVRFSNVKFSKAITLIGANTLGIYFIHVPLGLWLRSYYLELSFSKNLFAGLLFGLILLILSLIISLLLRRIPVIRNLVRLSN